ncbi:MAG TPA: type II toxin-antitoxin system HicA family toxin [Candidatus Nanoarchaeia archaeon]|nr:type II toxin-antitoxin system HicA family toxin [Candidatus Nanoarchaeia archaeon]
MKALQRAGFEIRNQTGSHVQMIGYSHNIKRLVTVPNHGNQEIPIGTVLSILRQSGLSREEFITLIK